MKLDGIQYTLQANNKKIGPILAINSGILINSMLLGKLIKNLPEKKLRIKGLSINSKNIANGFIFFAIRGHKSNGEKFINEAVSKGAKCICSKNVNILIIKFCN